MHTVKLQVGVGVTLVSGVEVGHGGSVKVGDGVLHSS
jgi:hypothetical protein